MKNQKQNYLGIVVIVGFIVFGLGGIYLKKQSQPSPLPIIEKKSITDTSNWTNYVNKTYSFNIKFPTTYEVKPGEEEQNTCVRAKLGNDGCVVLINVYDNKDNLTLENYLNLKIKSFPVTGPLVNYDFNGYSSLFNKNQPGTNLFIKRGLYVYRFIATKASSDKEIENIVATFKFLPGTSYGPQKIATVLVQDGSNYGPPFDSNLYQLEISKSKHLFAKSDLVDLKKYLGKNVEVKYREVIGVIMGEQQLVMVDSVK